MKYAFIMNSGSLNPEIYSAEFKNEENQCYFAAVHGMKMTRELAKKLADDGFEMIDLCGDYDEEKAEEIRKASENKIKVNYAKYTEEEMTKFNALPTSDQFGILVLASGIGDEPVKLELLSEEYNTYVTLIGKEEMAVDAVREMVEKGIHFIELCSYFDLEKAEAMAEAIEHKVPMGYCG